MVLHKVAIIQASLGGFDKESNVKFVNADFFLFSDSNYPLRDKAMTPRLQAKIPKFFGWQLKPNYKYYIWLDGNITLNEGALEYLLEQIQDHDIVVFRHPRRPNIRQEVRYTRKGINQQSIYVLNRYQNELYQEVYDIVQADKEYVDDLLVNGGIFIYRNIPEVQEMLKEWWYYVTRYVIQDQIPFPYVLKKSGLRINIRPDDIGNSPYFTINGHKKR